VEVVLSAAAAAAAAIKLMPCHDRKRFGPSTLLIINGDYFLNVSGYLYGSANIVYSRVYP
jgi:hypothetical protein